MAAHADILDSQDRFGAPLLGSVLLHVGVFAAIALIGYLHLGRKNSFGDPNNGQPSVGVDAVSGIPMPRRSLETSHVAHDTESQVMAPPEPAQKHVAAPEPDAVALRSRNVPKPKAKPDRRQEATATRRQPDRTQVASAKQYVEQPPRPNQLYSTEGRALSNPMYGQVGNGGVGLANNNPFGDRFGAYAGILQRLLIAKWRTLHPNIRTNAPAVLTVEIQRDGSFRVVGMPQTSGNYAVDTAAKRTLAEVAQFPPLPAGFDRSTAVVDFDFLVTQ